MMMPLPCVALPGALFADAPLCPRLQNNRGVTPLGIAVGFNKLPVIELLLEKGADVMLTDAAGNTVLHYAAGELAALTRLLPHPPAVVWCTEAMARLSTVHSCGCISGSSQAMAYKRACREARQGCSLAGAIMPSAVPESQCPAMTSNHPATQNTTYVTIA